MCNLRKEAFTISTKEKKRRRVTPAMAAGGEKKKKKSPILRGRGKNSEREEKTQMVSLI